jgi:hypothetical protein
MSNNISFIWHYALKYFYSAKHRWLTCNSTYSGGRDQDDISLKPAQENSSQDPILKKPITKRAFGVAQGIGPEFKPQYHKKITTQKIATKFLADV